MATILPCTTYIVSRCPGILDVIKSGECADSGNISRSEGSPDPSTASMRGSSARAPITWHLPPLLPQHRRVISALQRQHQEHHLHKLNKNVVPARRCLCPPLCSPSATLQLVDRSSDVSPRVRYSDWRAVQAIGRIDRGADQNEGLNGTLVSQEPDRETTAVMLSRNESHLAQRSDQLLERALAHRPRCRCADPQRDTPCAASLHIEAAGPSDRHLRFRASPVARDLR